jgi:hypothetical protein
MCVCVRERERERESTDDFLSLIILQDSLDTSKVVTGEDIREVFDNLKRKRRRLD